MKKEEFVINKQYNKILKAYENDKYKFYLNNEVTCRDIVYYFSENCSSKYIVWIMNQYIREIINISHINELKLTLEKFDKIKNQLNEKDICKYDYPKLLELCNSIEETISNKQRKKQNDNQIKKDVKWIIHTPNFKVLICDSQEISNLYGRYTKWCTTGRNTLFNGFNMFGHLYIILAGKRKFQLQMETKEFMNEIKENVYGNKSEIDYLSSFPEYKDFLNYLINTYYF